MKTLFTHANVVDVENHRVLLDTDILCDGGTIAAVGQHLTAPDDAVVDLTGKTVTPGLFNCHVHMTMLPLANPEVMAGTSTVGHTVNALGHLREYIETGVTFIRDVGSHDGVGLELRSFLQKGQLEMAPDMKVAGNCICMTGGHTWNMIGYEADGVDECRKAARLQLRNGVDWIKVMATGGVMTRGVEPASPQLNIDEMAAVVQEAHKSGVMVCTHAQGRTGIKNALKAGVDCIEHGCFLDEESLSMMKEQGSWFVPTLCAPYFINKYALGSGIPDYILRKNDMVNAAHQDSFRAAFRAGIPIACGTDAGTPFNTHSQTAMEAVLMVKYGLTPMDALEIATLNSAKLCGVENELGSVTVGKKAHLAVFDGDPTQDIEVLTHCVMTVKNGKILFQK